MRYSQEVIQSVIDANNIEDVVAQYTALKKSGRSLMGCCPFHNEKTPSFSVSPDKQFYHCFGCGVGGNVIGFIMAIENLSFPEAVRFLADRAGIQLPEKDMPEKDAEYEKKLRLYELNRKAANYYFGLLKKRKDAQLYLKERGLTAEVIKTFGLGVANNEWHQIIDYLRHCGFKDDELLDSGIACKGKDNRLYDRFRERIMIPIQNNHGKIIGFGGRSFNTADQNSPKYLNSPETMIFSKGNELFNLNNARKNKINNALILVEGYMDVIALYQYGIKNAIAALGTSFTVYHAKMISRYTDELILCFDGDNAGQKATVRALEILKDSPMNIRAVDLGNKEDPDSFARKYGAEAFLKKIEQADTAMGFLIRKQAEQFDINTSDGKTKFIRASVNLIRDIDNAAEAEIYAKRIAQTANVSEKSILKELSINGEQKIVPINEASRTKKKNNRSIEAQRYLCKIMISSEFSADQLNIDSALFTDEQLKRVFETISEARSKNSQISPSLIIEMLASESDKNLLAELMSEDFQPDRHVLSECVNTLQLIKDKKERLSMKKELEIIDSFNDAAAILAKSIVEKKKSSQLEEENNG